MVLVQLEVEGYLNHLMYLLLQMNYITVKVTRVNHVVEIVGLLEMSLCHQALHYLLM